jgi:hypothetical protein
MYKVRIQEPFSYFHANVKVSRLAELLDGREQAVKNKAKELFSHAVILDVRIISKI